MACRFNGPTYFSTWLRFGQSLWLVAAAVAWACAIGCGFWLVTDYELQPALTQSAPAQWPAASDIPRSEASATLLVFVHPRCPCSRASLSELARVIEQRSGPVSIHVLFTTPASADKSWTDTVLWRIAKEIPGIDVRNDMGGREATLFTAGASGHTLLYDAAGRLLFSGGITAARGHFGANPSSDRVISLLCASSDSWPIETPVYGCPLCISPEACEPKR